MTSGKFATTLGYERRFNPGFLYDDRDEFIAFMTHGQPSRPANILNIVGINQGRLPLSMELPDPEPLAAVQVEQMLVDGGAVLLDTRDVPDFGWGHPAGAVNIQLVSSQFEQRVGWVLPEGVPIVLLAEDEESVNAALRKLAFIGLERRVAGYLDGGFIGWIEAELPVVELPQYAPAEVLTMLQRGPLQVLDVRESDEWAEGHIAGAVHQSYRELSENLKALELDADHTVVVACAGGYRSSTASSLLLAAGFEKVINLDGGMDAWKAAGLPLV